VGRTRRLIAGSALGLAGYATSRLIRRRRSPAEDAADEDLLGSSRGRARLIRGPRASQLYAEWFLAPSTAEPPGRRGALVFTHGWCVSEAIWHLQKERFRDGPHTMVTWDLPGHGHSPPVARGHLTLDIGIDALARVVDEVEEPDVVLVGHSLGGILSVGYLQRHPETARRRVRGIVVASTPLVHHAGWTDGRWPGSAVQAKLVALGAQLAVENSLVDRWFAREAGSADPRAASYRLIRSGFGPDASPRHVRFVRDLAAAVPPAVRADTFRAMRGFDLRPLLPEIRVPALVLYGAHDRLVPPEESRQLASLLPRAQAVELAGAGHALFLERSEEFNRLVGRFAAKRLPARRPSGARVPARLG